MNQILTINQVAELLHVHPHTVRKWIFEGKLRASKPERKYLITSDAVTDLLKQTEFKGYSA